ncbi:MAG: hypothetical protein JSR60_16845 [Proteobacteria bacterium]|nr:hypothetical protein [Pseudomonadota bacterium]
MAAHAQSWKHEEFISGTPLAYARSFTPDEFARLADGFIPKQMEDKWFIYFVEPYLFLHRSWNGLPIYRVRLENTGDLVVVTEALWEDRAAGHSTHEYHAALLDFLIATILLGERKPFPVDPGFPAEKVQILQHAISGTGYPSKYLSRGAWWKFWKRS